MCHAKSKRVSRKVVEKVMARGCFRCRVLLRAERGICHANCPGVACVRQRRGQWAARRGGRKRGGRKRGGRKRGGRKRGGRKRGGRKRGGRKRGGRGRGVGRTADRDHGYV